MSQRVHLHPNHPSHPDHPDHLSVEFWHGPLWQGQKTALIGYPTEPAEPTKPTEPAQIRQLLELACTEAHAQGAELALGPINANTWHSYRLVTENPQIRGRSYPPFLFEPHNEASALIPWQMAGFTPHIRYHSNLFLEHTPDERAEMLAAKFADLEITNPTLAEPQLSKDLAMLHELSLEAFVNNPLFVPLDLAAFEGLYRPMLHALVQGGQSGQGTQSEHSAESPLDWIWLAKQHGQLLGYLFGYADPSGVMVLKTLAVRPQRAYAGLGRYLNDLWHQKAQASGRPMVHALMWDSNPSRHLVIRKTAENAEPPSYVLRRYALFGRTLSQVSSK